VLSDAEAERVRDDLKREWGVAGDYYPLERAMRADLRAYRREAFEAAGMSAVLPRLVEARGVRRPWQEQEDRLVFEIEPESLDILREPHETFWTSPALDGLAYVSHESSVTFGGWLLDDLLKVWSEASAAEW